MTGGVRGGAASIFLGGMGLRTVEGSRALSAGVGRVWHRRIALDLSTSAPPRTFSILKPHLLYSKKSNCFSICVVHVSEKNVI